MKKTYAEKKSFIDLEGLEKINIQEVGQYYSVKFDDIKDEWKSSYDYGEEVVDIALDSLNDVVKDGSSYEYDYFDETEYVEYVGSLMDVEKYNHYLVFAYNCRWNGASGYSIVDDYEDCFCRNYDTSMYYQDGSSSGKWMCIKEYSHDVPMGSDTYIIGLTDKEYERLNDCNFGKIQEFIEDKCKIQY